MDIPKPAPEENLGEDTRQKYLEEWKRLFTIINNDIAVVIYTESHFRRTLENTYGDIEFDARYHSNARIVITLPDKFGFTYLVGMSGDHMFSEYDVLSDPLIHEEHPYPCEPTTKKWSEYYHEVCDIEKNLREEIPKPPSII